MRPPLDLIALFAEDVPARKDLTAGSMPLFAAQVVKAPFPQLAGPLEDLNQPLEPVERLHAARARAGLHLRCAADLHPARRLPSCLERIELLADLGAVAFVLPAAHKIFGPSAFAAVAERGGGAWTTLFLHRHLIEEGERVWLHTHGMEHFGLPDLELRGALSERDAALRLLDGAIGHLLRHGEVQDGAPFEARPAPAAGDHEYGAWGALALAPREGTA